MDGWDTPCIMLHLHLLATIYKCHNINNNKKVDSLSRWVCVVSVLTRCNTLTPTSNLDEVAWQVAWPEHHRKESIPWHQVSTSIAAMEQNLKLSTFHFNHQSEPIEIKMIKDIKKFLTWNCHPPLLPDRWSLFVDLIPIQLSWHSFDNEDDSQEILHESYSLVADSIPNVGWRQFCLPHEIRLAFHRELEHLI